MAAMDTVNISIGCMKPGSMCQKEPRQAAVDQEFRKRMRLDSKALAENTLMLATRDPIMLLRVRQKEHQHKPAVGDGQFWVFSNAKEYQHRMKARKIFDEMMQEANAWRAKLVAEVSAVGVFHDVSIPCLYRLVRSQFLSMVIKSTLKVRAASGSGLGQLQGSVRSLQEDGTVVVMMEVELPILPSDDIQALPAPMRTDLVGPGVFLMRGKTEWIISLKHSADDESKHVELVIEVITETAPLRRSPRYN